MWRHQDLPDTTVTRGGGAEKRRQVCLTGTFINAAKDTTVLQAHGDVPRSHLSEPVKRSGDRRSTRRVRHAEPANGDRGQEQDSSL